jgi:hypothetical protein
VPMMTDASRWASATSTRQRARVATRPVHLGCAGHVPRPPVGRDERCCCAGRTDPFRLLVS